MTETGYASITSKLLALITNTKPLATCHKCDRVACDFYWASLFTNVSFNLASTESTECLLVSQNNTRLLSSTFNTKLPLKLPKLELMSCSTTLVNHL